MKLRMVRFLRTPEYDELFLATRSGQPNLSVVWASTVVPGYQKQLPFPEHPVHHGSVSEPNMTILWSEKLPLNFKKFALKCPSTPLLCSMRTMT